MPSLPQFVVSVLPAYAAPLLAFVVALGGAMLFRSKARRAWLPAAGPLAVIAGWATLLPLPSVIRLALAPRGIPEALLAPAVAGLLPVAWRSGRLARALPVLLAGFAGWWLAETQAGRVEFWRVGFAVTVLALVMWRGVQGQPVRGLAAGLALWGGLVLLGSGARAIGSALVAVAAFAGLLPAGAGAALPSATLAALIGAVDLGSGRLVRAGLDGSDFACIGAILAPFLHAPIATRVGKRFGAAGPLLAAIAAAGLAVAVAWILRRAFAH